MLPYVFLASLSIDLDITNITNTPFSFWSDGIYLVDNKNRNFEPYDSIGAIDNYIEARDLAPFITENGRMVFELPADSENYSMSIIKGGTNEEYLLNLK